MTTSQAQPPKGAHGRQPGLGRRIANPLHGPNNSVSGRELGQLSDRLGALLGAIDQVSPELVAVVKAWPQLPTYVRQAVQTLVESAAPPER